MSDYRIYVASLADYVAGRLHGVWIDADGKTADELQSEVNAMLLESPEPIAEEYAIHDHEGFGDLIGEYTPLSEVAAIVGVLESSSEPDALREFADHYGYTTTEAAERFDEAYQGQWDSKVDFAAQLLDDIAERPNDDSLLARYFDYNAFARDLFLGDYTMTDSGYVFDDLH